MKVVGQLVVGPGEADRYLETTLQEFQRLTDDAVAVTCNATQKEITLLDRYDIRHYEDNREWGRYQPDIKTRLLGVINRLSPDWVLPLDADESLLSIRTRASLEECTRHRIACFFYVVNLWNDETHYKKSLGFWNVRLYAPRANKETQFLRKPVHCGNAPPFFYNQAAKDSYVPHILLHKGLMRKEDRLRKVQRYEQYDPHAIHKGRDYYDALQTDTCAEYHQEAVISKITNYIYGLQPRRTTPKAR